MTPNDLVENLGTAAELAGVATIVAGIVFAAARAAWPSPSARVDRYRRCRRDLGRGILLGLEVLVAADIIRSVALEPTIDSLAVLGMIVVIRTFLSLGLTVELEERWPWQRTARSTD